MSRRWGPARTAYQLHLNISTVHRILTRYLCPSLRFTHSATGIRVRRRDRARRYEYAWQGEMIHVGVKKLGRIPDGGGHRVHGRVPGNANSRARNLSEGHAKYRHREAHPAPKIEDASRAVTYPPRASAGVRLSLRARR
ncbi:hypothetical protein M8J71_20200 [Pseudarthrobacter sp. R1]|uniref:hypothetical protein n=1 Tax=Pseudarthrobacter sp. R1 TaxID=2944934 RepID=UPI00210D0765|nr:hypothetical protein [Pseudarthrobacter sp. R1]MCQ6272782.1 hypothetical protein [Pseudarthrobacter sp. R1]